MRIRPITALLMFALSISVFAETYRSVGPDGTVIFSDKPVPGAELVREQPVLTYPAPRTTKRLSPDSRSKTAFSGYQTIEIASPANDETFWNNNGNVILQVNLTPGLQTQLGHKLVLYLDDQPLGDPSTASSRDLGELERGSHTVRATVIDKSGSEIGASSAATFHIKRTSAILNKQQRDPSSNKPR